MAFMVTPSPYHAARRDIRRLMGRLEQTVGANIVKALQVYQEEIFVALIGAKGLPQAAAMSRTHNAIVAAKTKLEKALMKTIAQARGAAFGDVEDAMNRAMEETIGIKGGALGAVRVPPLSMMNAYESLGAPATWETLLGKGLKDLDDQINTLVRSNILRGGGPDALARSLRPFVRSGTALDQALLGGLQTPDPKAFRDTLLGALKKGEAEQQALYAQIMRTQKFNAERIAFTELHNARAEAEVFHAARDPLVKALKWTLSPNRGRGRTPDVCDVLAAQDAYGMGPGVYPVDRVPFPPHPFDRCERIPVMRPWKDRNKAKPKGDRSKTAHLSVAYKLYGPEWQKSKWAVSQASAARRATFEGFKLSQQMTKPLQEQAAVAIAQRVGGQSAADLTVMAQVDAAAAAEAKAQEKLKAQALAKQEAEAAAAAAEPVPTIDELTDLVLGKKPQPKKPASGLSTGPAQTVKTAGPSDADISQAFKIWVDTGYTEPGPTKDLVALIQQKMAQTVGSGDEWAFWKDLKATVSKKKKLSQAQGDKLFEYIQPPGGPALTKARSTAPPLIQPLRTGPVIEVATDVAEDVVLHQNVGAALGSNPGGFYVGKDGVKRYVKFYSNPTQAGNEAVANAVYGRLGLRVPKSGLTMMADGRVAVWTEVLEGTTLQKYATATKSGVQALTEAQAKEILEGFGADILTLNWDAIGTGFDNIFKSKAGHFYRIDQGGSLLFRAQAGMKKAVDLEGLKEWSTFLQKNPYYKELLGKAGVSATTDYPLVNLGAQIQKIVKLKQELGGSFRPLVRKFQHVLPKEQVETIIQLLDDRADAMVKAWANLEQEIAAVERELKVAKLAAEKRRQARLTSQKNKKAAKGADPDDPLYTPEELAVREEVEKRVAAEFTPQELKNWADAIKAGRRPDYSITSKMHQFYGKEVKRALEKLGYSTQEREKLWDAFRTWLGDWNGSSSSHGGAALKFAAGERFGVDTVFHGEYLDASPAKLKTFLERDVRAGLVQGRLPATHAAFATKEALEASVQDLIGLARAVTAGVNQGAGLKKWTIWRGTTTAPWTKSGTPMPQVGHRGTMAHNPVSSWSSNRKLAYGWKDHTIEVEVTSDSMLAHYGMVTVGYDQEYEVLLVGLHRPYKVIQ